MTTTVLPDGDQGIGAGRTDRHRMPHLPALDGLRGLAVIGVLLFHSGFDWARGGYLGVSTFFTLSGFLITNLLVREWDAQGTIRLGGFWTRRFRRLLPAAVLTIAVTGVVFWRLGTPEQLQNLRLDMLAALGYVANWRFYLAGTSYGSLFAAPSPLQHFWSLAIEEQFYLFFPPIVILLMRRGGRRLLGTVVVAAALASVALCVILRTDPDRVYYGTDTRVAELLFGVLLALWWSAPARGQRPEGRRNSDTTGPSRVLDVAGLLALGGMFLGWWHLSETSTWLARGGLPIYAACTTVIILAGTRRGVVTAILSNRVLRWGGLISYGLYLYHWPVFLVLSPSRTGWAPWPLFALRMAVTISIALVSYRFLEMPIRRGRMFTTGRSALVAGIGAAVVVALLAVAITLHPPASTAAFADVAIGDTSTYGQHHVEDQITAAGAPDAVFIIGDSGMVDEQTALEAAFHSAGVGHVELGAGPGFGLSQPLDWRGTWKTVDDAQINAVLATLPTTYPGVVFHPSVGASLLRPDGTYGISYIDDAGHTVLLRKPDGWHLCQEGAARFAQEVLDAAVSLGLSPPADRPWRDGPWVDAANFDDPVGACPH